jgi:hypothetical protein
MLVVQLLLLNLGAFFKVCSHSVFLALVGFYPRFMFVLSTSSLNVGL